MHGLSICSLNLKNCIRNSSIGHWQLATGPEICFLAVIHVIKILAICIVHEVMRNVTEKATIATV